jgi:hypothetical protein
VKLIKETAAAAKQVPSDAVAIVSYDEHPNRNSRTASWLPWMNSIAIPSFTPGPINSTKLPDMIRISKSMY